MIPVGADPTTGPVLMTNRRLYAQLSAALIWLWGCDRAVAAQSRPADPPCGVCITITIAPGQSLLLPETLSELTVLVRATFPSDAALTAAIDQIRQRGGRPGIVLVSADDERQSVDRLAFELKGALTEYRAAAGGSAVMAVLTPGRLRQPLLDRGLAAYADLLPQPAPEGDLGAALELHRRGTGDVAVAAPSDVVAARAFLGAAARAASMLPRGLAPLSTPTVSCANSSTKVLLHPRSQELIALLRCGRESDLRIAPPHRVLERADLGGGFVIVRLAPPSADRFTDEVQVRAGRRLSVEEVIARHQAAVRRQAGITARVISSGTMTLTFEAPGFPAPVTVSAETTVYADHGRTELEQRDIRINGVTFQGKRIPRLPILEPERVTSAPLVISLTDQYRYRLEDDDTVHGVRCYVVSFEPTGPGSLFNGRAWIAMDSFGMARVAATQTRLRGAIISSEQVDEFREVQTGVWLLAHSDVRQIYEGAAHRTPIHRRMTLVDHRIDPADFEARRAAAYASTAVMLRDTAQGYRYLRRQPASAGDKTPAVVEVAKAATHVRTLAGGVIIDPNISVPLPFAGLSYVDFDLFGTGTQFTGFFGGTYGQMAFSVPSIRKSRWQLAGRAFAIASSYNDRSFRNGREIYEEALRQRPAHASVWVLRPVTSRISVRVGYDLDYTRLRAAPETGEAFVVPANQVVHGARVGARRAARRLDGICLVERRETSRLARVGRGDRLRPAPRHVPALRRDASPDRPCSYRASSREWRGNGWTDGTSTASVDTRSGHLTIGCAGYPSALVRYDRGGVVRGALAWSAAKALRVDGFLDTAAVRDPGYGSGLRNYTGLGAAAEVPHRLAS